MSPQSPQEAMDDILEAITRARLVDRRMKLAESLTDEAGVQIAYQAFLHNVFVIGEAVKALPPEVLAQAPATPWAQFVEMREVIEPHYLRINPDDVHRTVEADLGSLDLVVRRLRAVQ